MKKFSLIAAGLIAAVSIAAVSAQQGPTAKSNKVVLDYCLISAFEQVQVPARSEGVLMAFEENTSYEGSEVKEGDILAHLDQRDLIAKKESAELDIVVSQEKAASDAELEVAKASKAVFEKELEGALAANKKSPGTVPQNELRRMQLQVDRAGHEIRLRQMERKVQAFEVDSKKAQLQAVEVEIERREVASPLDGVVVERLKRKGEWVQPGETILKIVRLNRLRVEGMVPANQYSPLQMAGAPVVVSVEIPGGKIETVEGTIGFVSPVVEASGDYRVWTEVENRKVGKHWVFSPGTTAKMEVTLTSGKAAPATRPVSARLK